MNDQTLRKLQLNFLELTASTSTPSSEFLAKCSNSVSCPLIIQDVSRQIVSLIALSTAALYYLLLESSQYLLFLPAFYMYTREYVIIHSQNLSMNHQKESNEGLNIQHG
ncbi:conserved hypothetical protein [Trichinella spiralis]|uniref:hypothetical protein n=1 Tax=Trichinella spiralis TaxID=6334 RepID=UPI0001EFB6C2|nr:conserved hypothetical protein [Trichinella spiralis]